MKTLACLPLALAAVIFLDRATTQEPVESSFTVQEATITDIHRAFQSGELTARGLVQMYLDRIEAYDRPNDMNAFVVLNPNALERADDLDR